MTASEKRMAEFDEEFAMTRKFLDLVPDDKLLWKPHEKSRNWGALPGTSAISRSGAETPSNRIF
jgi:hypothetical protein